MLGAYWISSIRSLRKTTFPGDTAMFCPTLCTPVATWRGEPPLLIRSLVKLRAPLASDRPPDSKARLITAGLPRKKFVGATASTNNCVANSAFRLISSVVSASRTMDSKERSKAR